MEDAEAIARLHVASWQAAYRGLLPDDLLDSLDLEEWTERRRRMLAEPPNPLAKNWVLEDSEGLIGWASAGPARDEDADSGVAEVFAIYLDPARVGQGHGRRLMEHCFDVARGEGYRSIVLWVLAGNARADRFYRAAGFLPDESREPEPFRDTGATKLRLLRAL